VQAEHEILGGDWLAWSPQTLPPSSWVVHVPLVAWLVERERPGLCVELGTGDGRSFRVLCRSVDRFAPGGRLVGVDLGRSGTGATEGADPDDSHFAALREYCRMHHPDTSSVRRVDLHAAAGEFEGESIDLLHLAGAVNGDESAQVDISVWLPKLRPGGIILLTCGEDDGPGKLWGQVEGVGPSVTIGLPSPCGVVQVPGGGAAASVELLAATPFAPALFRCLGERFEYRHLLGPDPASPEDLRRRISQLISASADAEQLEDQMDVLLARMAAQASDHERQMIASKRSFEEDLARAEARFVSAVDELSARYAADLAAQHVSEYTELRAEIASRDAHIEAMSRTVSWRVTRPLRMVQSLRMRLTRRPH
jgi:hypothetical protein